MLSGVLIVCASLRKAAARAHNYFVSQGNTKHREIFSFERVTEGRYEGNEWEDIVKPVIEKWGGFVEAYL
jgi:hypothetical protein